MRHALLDEDELLLIGAMLGMMARTVSPAMADHLARCFLVQPPQLGEADVKTICTGLGALKRDIRKDTVLVREQRNAVMSKCDTIIKKLERQN